MFLDGEYNGLATASRDDTLMTSIYYVDGKFEGPFVNHRPDGRMNSETNYKDGKKHGFRKVWYDDAEHNIKAEYKFDHDNLVKETLYSHTHNYLVIEYSDQTKGDTGTDEDILSYTLFTRDDSLIESVTNPKSHHKNKVFTVYGLEKGWVECEDEDEADFDHATKEAILAQYRREQDQLDDKRIVIHSPKDRYGYRFDEDQDMYDITHIS